MTSGDLRARVVNLCSRGGTTMLEVVETLDVSLGFVWLLVIDRLGGLPTHTPQTLMDDHGCLTPSACYPFER